MRCSVSVSTDEVASSSTSMISGLNAIARANARSCFWPTESVEPRSVTTVSYPSGSRSMNLSAFTNRAAARTCSSVIAVSFSRMFDAIVPAKMKGSWSTTPTWRRTSRCARSRRSTPSRRIRPFWTS